MTEAVAERFYHVLYLYAANVVSVCIYIRQIAIGMIIIQ
jgi:hypothetical protein